MNTLLLLVLFMPCYQYAENVTRKQKVKNAVSALCKKIPSKKTCIVALSAAASTAVSIGVVLKYADVWNRLFCKKNDVKTDVDEQSSNSNAVREKHDFTTSLSSVDDHIAFKPVSFTVLKESLACMAPIKCCLPFVVKKVLGADERFAYDLYDISFGMKRLDTYHVTPVIYTLESIGGKEHDIQAKFIILLCGRVATIIASSLRTVDEKYVTTDRYAYGVGTDAQKHIFHEVFHEKLYLSIVDDLRSQGYSVIVHDSQASNSDYWVVRGFPKLNVLTAEVS